MKTTRNFFIAIILTLSYGCDNSKTVSKKTPPSSPVIIIDAEPEPLKEVTSKDNLEIYKRLIFNTKLSINPKQPNWVLFSNGTYILFSNGISNDSMRQSALGLLQRYNGESFSITKSPLVKGWIAGSTRGIYNYVSLEQAGDRLASKTTLRNIGKENVLKDKANPIIIHVNTQ